jgi:UDP-GalNAc:undecaprenyl-phosphate GalNAc-1-phosphate transferase
VAVGENRTRRVAEAAKRFWLISNVLKVHRNPVDASALQKGTVYLSRTPLQQLLPDTIWCRKETMRAKPASALFVRPLQASAFRPVMILAHALVFTAILLFSSWLAWKTFFFWEYHHSTYLLVGLTVLAFGVSITIAEHLNRVPRTNFLSRNLFAASVAFGLVLVAVSIGRFYYSRSFLLSSYGLTVIWLVVQCLLTAKYRKPIFAVIPHDASEELCKSAKANWVSLKTPDLSVGVDGVVADLHQKQSDQWLRFLADCSLKGIPVHHSAFISEMFSGRVSVEHLSKGLDEDFRAPPLYRYTKRGIDLALFIVTLPLTLPVCAIVALLIKIDSPGPVLFKQYRVGQGGKVFKMKKFRTMTVPQKGKDEARFADAEDARVTRIGKHLRKYRLDELPQFWNIMRGEMSLIGPRPEQVDFVKQFNEEIPFYSFRHFVKPGITGWAQVHHGYAAGLETTRGKLEYDLFYNKHLSFTLDCIIIFQTIRTVLTGFGAR